MSTGSIVTVLIIAVILVVFAVYSFFKRKDKEESTEELSLSSLELSTADINVQKKPAETQAKETDDNGKTKEKLLTSSEKVGAIAFLVLVLSILAGTIAGIAIGSKGEDYAAVGFGVFAACFIGGLVVFGILYGIAHIMENTDVTRQEAMDINRKLEKLIEKQGDNNVE